MILPVPGSTRAKSNGAYSADSGADVLCPVNTPIVAAFDGTIVYSEWGHTVWGTTQRVGIDTPYSILIELDRPLEDRGKTYFYTWYTHLKSLVYNVPDDGNNGPRVKAGATLGYSGIGNGVPHLHFGILADRRQRGPSDWMAPARVAELLWDSKEEGPKNPNPHEPPAVGTIKVFQEDDGLTVLVDGKKYIGLGVKEADTVDYKDLKPWTSKQLLIRFRR